MNEEFNGLPDYVAIHFLIALIAKKTYDFPPAFRTDLDENSCPMNLNCYNQSDSNNNNTGTIVSSQKQKKFLQLLSNTSALYGANSMKSSTSASASSSSSFFNQPKSYSGSNSSSSCASSLADLDDITIVKEEPLSPHSSCPPSPTNYGNALPSISSINPDLMYDRKVNRICSSTVLCFILTSCRFHYSQC
jgi:hypothetical protein